MYCIELGEDTGINAEIMMRELGKKGIGTRPFFLGLHEQPVLRDMNLFKGKNYPVTERISRQGLYLPSGLALTEKEIDVVVEGVREIIKNQRSKIKI